MARPAKYQVKIGQKINNLTICEIVKTEHKAKNMKTGVSLKLCAVCKCDCGNITGPILINKLMRNHTTSCGCNHKQNFSNFKHGHNRKGKVSRIYRTWSNMLTRCYNPKVEKYKIYGGRGIKVCEKWHTFEGFYEDMHEGYNDTLTIDRIDNNKDYCKENCRWATWKEQANNRGHR